MILQKILVERSPWHMLVGCMLLNLTSRKQVDKAWPRLFELWRRPIDAIFSPEHDEEIRELLTPLGLVNKRMTAIKQMSFEYCLHAERHDFQEKMINPRELHGIGKYAEDSWKIFVLGERLSPDDVDDKELKRYLEQVNSDSGRTQGDTDFTERLFYRDALGGA